MFQSLKNIFSADQGINLENEINEIDILCGLMIEAAYTDGKITQEELNKISNSLINVSALCVQHILVSIAEVMVVVKYSLPLPAILACTTPFLITYIRLWVNANK